MKTFPITFLNVNGTSSEKRVITDIEMKLLYTIQKLRAMVLAPWKVKAFELMVNFIFAPIWDIYYIVTKSQYDKLKEEEAPQRTAAPAVDDAVNFFPHILCYSIL